MKTLFNLWIKPKPLLWVLWADYCGIGGVWTLWLINQHGAKRWELSVIESVTWPMHLVQAGWAMIGGAA